MLTIDSAKWLTFVAAVGVFAAPAFPAMGERSAVSHLVLTVVPQCGVSIQSDVPDGGGRLLTFLYKIRTGKVGGSGTVELRLTGPIGGGPTLEYRTELSGTGTPVSGSVPLAGAGSGVVVARFGERTGSSRAGDTGRVRYTVSAPAGAAIGPASLTIACH
jgi:hypothetical protein